MAPTIEPLVEYIQAHRAHGAHDEQIWIELLNASWPYELIQAGFDNIDGANTVAPNMAAAQTAPPSGSPAPIAVRQKYKVTTAIADVFRGLKVNWQTVIGGGLVILIAITALSVVVLLAGIVLFRQFFADLALNPLLLLNNPARLFVIVGVLYVVLLILGALFNSMLLSGISLTLRDGLDGNQGKVFPTIRRTFSTLIRVALANALMAITIVGPFLLAGILVAGLSILMRDRSLLVILIGLISFIATGVWVVVAFLRYWLAPYVALFETDIRLRNTLGRSKSLMYKGGQWFLVKSVLLTLAFGLVYAVIVELLGDNPPLAILILLIIVNVLVSFIAIGMYYALYRNRVAVKG